MTDFEYLESIGQITIFDYLDIVPVSNRNKSFMEGDRVKIHFYAGELYYIHACHPQLITTGAIVGKELDLYEVKFLNGETVEVLGEKLFHHPVEDQ